MTRFYNPFRFIRLLREDLADTEFKLAQARDSYNVLRVSRDHNQNMAAARGFHLAQHAQAVDAFMDERVELKQILDGTERVAEIAADNLAGANEHLADLYDVLSNVAADRNAKDATIASLALIVEQAIDYTTDLEREVAQQASEILEIVSWVKAAEAALFRKGIQVLDTPEGPVVALVQSQVAPLRITAEA